MVTQQTPNQLLKAARQDLGWTQAQVADARGIHSAAYAKIERADDIKWSTLVDTANALGGRLTLCYEHPDLLPHMVSTSPWASLTWLADETFIDGEVIRAFARALRDVFDVAHILRSPLLIVIDAACLLDEQDVLDGLSMLDGTLESEQFFIQETQHSTAVTLRGHELAIRMILRHRVSRLAQALTTPGLADVASAAAEVGALVRYEEDPTSPIGHRVIYPDGYDELPVDAQELLLDDHLRDLAVYLRDGAEKADRLIELTSRFVTDDEYADRILTAAGYPPLPGLPTLRAHATKRAHRD